MSTSPNGPYSADLALALNIADAVDALTLPGFAARDFAVETKPDNTPVTELDRAAELLIREALAAALPEDGIVGEEYGTKNNGVRDGNTRTWIVDPIDGTKNFLRGVPVWATLIGLMDDGVMVMGVVSAPALGMRWFASKGDGAWKGQSVDGAQRLSVSKIADLGEASLSYSSLTGWEERAVLAGFLDLSRAVWRTRAYGDFWSYMLVAEGVVDIACEPELALYDMAALVAIVEEAGGTFTSLTGEPGPTGGNAIASNGLLHDAALAFVKTI